MHAAALPDRVRADGEMAVYRCVCVYTAPFLLSWRRTGESRKCGNAGCAFAGMLRCACSNARLCRACAQQRDKVVFPRTLCVSLIAAGYTHSGFVCVRWFAPCWFVLWVSVSNVGRCGVENVSLSLYVYDG